MTQKEIIEAVLKIMAKIHDDNLHRGIALTKEGGKSKEFNRLIADSKALNRVADILVSYDNANPENQGDENELP